MIDVNKVVFDGRTTIMVRNIPNKYTQDMLLELFENNNRKKFDFFYLPIDYNVSFYLFRIIVMSDMPLSILFTPNLYRISIENSITENGIDSTQLRFVKYVTLGYKEQLNWSTILSTLM